MGATSSVLLANYPTDGWSSSWGLSNSPRPGGMTRVYRITGDQAWGNASPFGAGMNFVYLDAGSQSSMRWDGTTKLFGSLTVPFMLWDHFSDSATQQVLFIEWGIFPIPDFPFVCQWADQYTILIPPSRLPFTVPIPFDNPCGVLHRGGFGDVKPEIRPLNDNAVDVWV